VRNQVEKELSQQQRSTGILVPLFEHYMTRGYGYWDQDDQQFLARLMLKDSRREAVRRKRPTYSPSLLGGCRRHTFLAAHHKRLKITPTLILKPETRHYFWTGTWAHLRLQLRLYQLHKNGYLRLRGVEIPVGDKEHNGTLDAIVEIRNIPYVVDFKYVNDRAFQQVVDKQVPEGYKIQIADYVTLVNEDPDLPDVSNALLLVERKSGPTPEFPAALCEYRVNLKVNQRKANDRIKELQAHVQADTIPEPECTSVTQAQFTGCPFRGYCKKEVRQIERQAAADSSNTPKFRVAVPEKRGADRSR
jgi:hypothetical protein